MAIESKEMNESALYTRSAKFYPHYQMPLIVVKDADISRNWGAAERYRLVIFTEGTGYLACGERTVPFMAPSLVCLRNGEFIDEVKSPGYRATVLPFHPAIVNASFTYERIASENRGFSRTEDQDLYCLLPFIGRDPYAFQPILLGPHNELRIHELVDRIGDQLATTDHNGWPCLTRSYFIELLFYVERVRSINPSLDPVCADPLVANVLVYLNTFYPDRITIDSLTDKFATNRTTLAERFSKSTGTTVIDYLNRLRTHIAGLMLRGTMLPVSDIMYRVGFNDPTHFGRIFRVNQGYTPSDYRREFSGR